MSDYIDRQAAIDDILKHKNSVIEGCEARSYTKQIYGMANDHVCELINILPSADVEPVQHAKPDICDHRDGSFSFVCSGCKANIDPEYNYCRRCGAILKER